MSLRPEHADLLVAVVMPLPHELPLGVAVAFDGHLPHDGACLLWIVWRGTRQHHRFDALRLLRRHVQKRLAAGARADGFTLFNREMIEQGEDVERRLPEGELARRIGRAPVTA